MRFIIILICFLFFAFGELASQSNPSEADKDPELYASYQSAIDYFNSFKIDSAGVVLDSILAEIKDTQTYDSSFGLRVQLLLQQVKEKAIKKKLWDVYANASINLGLVYEKIGKFQDCIENLRDAQRTLKKHPELDYLYPHFCVRISSYHRIYAHRDSAHYYAQECLRTYEQHNDYAQGGDGYMLMTLLTDREDIESRMKYAKKGAEIYRKIGNYDALSYMLAGVSQFHLSKGESKKALMYNDSTISAARKSIAGGFEIYHALYSAYKFRGEIFDKMGKHDSAAYYVRKGFELHNLHIQKENNDKILEMDAKFKDDQMSLKIEEQAKKLQSAKIQRLLMMVIFGLVTLFIVGLIYYYNKLRKAKRHTELQAEQIKKTNEQLSKSLNRQIVLQGEVHHRVKNNLQVIISLLELQKVELKNQEAKDNLDSMSKRIYSMAAIHNLLYQKEEMEFIKLHDYVENLCYHFSNFSLEQDKPIFELDIDDISLNLETSMPIGIIITELLTNSIKYARVSGEKLKITMRIKQMDDGIIIYFKDNGPGFEKDVETNKSSGLGFYILESMTRQLQGKLIKKNDNGASYEIHLVEKNKWNEEDLVSSLNKN